ncbi:hypothetical protein GCM10023230_07310 [Flavobacterium hankyongi]|uniref:Uncharacterized protein n=1 Tax=Flavobacterium hankyongi TaxID=1176532 RepID=A0ABP8ZP64_9FLAO
MPTNKIVKFDMYLFEKRKISPNFIRKAVKQTNEAFDKLITFEVKNES